MMNVKAIEVNVGFSSTIIFFVWSVWGGFILHMMLSIYLAVLTMPGYDKPIRNIDDVLGWYCQAKVQSNSKSQTTWLEVILKLYRPPTPPTNNFKYRHLINRHSIFISFDLMWCLNPCSFTYFLKSSLLLNDCPLTDRETELKLESQRDWKWSSKRKSSQVD